MKIGKIRRKIAVLFVFVLTSGLCACSAESGQTAAEEAAVLPEPEPVAPDEEPYTGNGSVWCSALFETPSTVYHNDLAIVAAEMCSEAADKPDERITSLYSDYGLYALKSEYYVTDETSGAKALFGGGAFSIGQDTLYIDGVDTAVLVITVRGSVTPGEYVGDWLKGEEQSFLGRNVWNNVYDFEEKVWKGITDYTDQYPAIKTKENLKVLITGHSLGGAAACMVGARLTEEAENNGLWASNASKEDIYVYTFGAIKTLTTEENVSEGYENIHNIYNYYDSFGPNGNQRRFNASSPNAKFGHTELYRLLSDETLTSCYSHFMDNYKSALKKEQEEGGFIELACAGKGGTHQEEETETLTEEELPAEEGAGEAAADSPVDDFVIEGKWKSIGESGFGQAQPGAIVAFDGIHCNFYSPQDTYAFYQEDGKWRLDCTSFLFSETLIFDVEIIDRDTVNLYYGSTCTSLKRVE